MLAVLKTAGWLGGLLTIIALVIMLLRQIIALVGFMMTVLKVGIFLIFLLLIVVVGYLILRDFQKRRRTSDD
jgi:nitrate reductase gamma subunit